MKILCVLMTFNVSNQIRFSSNDFIKSMYSSLPFLEEVNCVLCLVIGQSTGRKEREQGAEV